MLSVTFSRVRDGEEDRLREWGRELMQRAGEVRETFRQEGVRHERSFLIRTSEGWVLIRAGEVEAPERALEAYKTSTLRIDAEHRAVMESTLEGPFAAEQIYECSL
ncbi:MAG TPA: DUF6176 family protein [Candidatus Dormibacteraeota bacterium]|nr:DUF6176 family protein [Candidatus Dormibacteraeota bacterium]